MIYFLRILFVIAVVSVRIAHTHTSAINAFLDLKKAFDYEAPTIIHTVIVQCYAFSSLILYVFFSVFCFGRNYSKVGVM